MRFGGAPSYPGRSLPYTLTWFDGGKGVENKNHVNCNQAPKHHIIHKSVSPQTTPVCSQPACLLAPY